MEITRNFILASVVAFFATSASAQTIKGPVSATVVRVIDGDTVVVNADIWPGIVVHEISVRVDGIDTPERRGKCDAEKQLAESAKLMMADLFAPGSAVDLRNVREANSRAASLQTCRAISRAIGPHLSPGQGSLSSITAGAKRQTGATGQTRRHQHYDQSRHARLTR